MGGNFDGAGEELLVSQFLGSLAWVFEVMEVTQMKDLTNKSQGLPYDPKVMYSKYKLWSFQRKSLPHHTK